MWGRSRTAGSSVRGAAADGGAIRAVRVNGASAESLGRNYSQWEVVLERVAPGALELIAVSEDEAGNIEKNPHRMSIVVR